MLKIDVTGSLEFYEYIINSDQMEHVTVRGAQTVTSIHSVAGSVGNAGVYSRMKTVIKVPNVILRQIVPSILHLLSQFDNFCDRLWRKSKFLLHHVPSTPVAQWLSYSPLDPSFAGSIPAGVDGFIQSVNIVSMTSFRRKVKPWVPCRRFTACIRTSSRN